TALRACCPALFAPRHGQPQSRYRFQQRMPHLLFFLVRRSGYSAVNASIPKNLFRLGHSTRLSNRFRLPYSTPFSFWRSPTFPVLPLCLELFEVFRTTLGDGLSNFFAERDDGGILLAFVHAGSILQ